jgi:hypothetical protein
MRPIILLPKLHLSEPLQIASPAFAPPKHHLIAIAAFQGLESEVVDRFATAEIEEDAFGFGEREVVGLLRDGEEGGGVGGLDGHVDVEDELEGDDFFGRGGGWGRHCCWEGM